LNINHIDALGFLDPSDCAPAKDETPQIVEPRSIGFAKITILAKNHSDTQKLNCSGDEALAILTEHRVVYESIF